MEAQNKQLALLKAINSHEQALAGLVDLMSGETEGPYSTMLERIKTNLVELHDEVANTEPEDLT